MQNSKLLNRTEEIKKCGWILSLGSIDIVEIFFSFNTVYANITVFKKQSNKNCFVKIFIRSSTNYFF